MGIISMCFNLGLHGLLGFHRTLTDLEEGNWQAAHDDVLKSLADRQAPARYSEIANIFLTGSL